MLTSTRAELSCKRSCPDPEKWMSNAGRMSGTKESVRILNAHLDALQSKVFEIYKTLLQKESPISAEIIKARMLAKVEKVRMLLDIFKEHNLYLRKQSVVLY